MEKENLIAIFKEFLESTNEKKSGKVRSYFTAIKMVFKFLNIKNTVNYNEIQRIKQFQTKIKNKDSKEYKDFYNHCVSKSYLEGGFVSAGLKSFFDFYDGRDSNSRDNGMQGPVVLDKLPEMQNYDDDELEIDDERKYRHYTEGGRTSTTISGTNRSSAARRACLEKHGYACNICGFDFNEFYGEIGKNVIEVHHLEPLVGREKSSATDPEKDLMPVCSNCHSMLHEKQPAYTPYEIRENLKFKWTRSGRSKRFGAREIPK